MLFSSPEFILFIIVFVGIISVTDKKFTNILIIIASSFFYAWWKVEYIWLPYLLTAIAFCGGRWISNSDADIRKSRLIITICILFLPLLVFKYTDFFYAEIVGIFTDARGDIIGLSLPLGISFITFTLTAYLIDIYRKRFPADRKFSVVLAYVLFFPHLIAGPILHPGELIPQLEEKRVRIYRRILVPLAVFSVGLVKKLVFADQIAVYVDAVYAQAGVPSAPEALLAIIGFMVQIFCDFSGYTDMALAVALLIGIKLPNNFLRPYTAYSIADLWRRWHITLTRFLMNYVYSPFSLWAMHRKYFRGLSPILRVTISVILPMNLTFLISGLWHGAGWNYILFGVVTGVAMSIESLWRWKRMPKLNTKLAWLLTMVIFNISLVFFRSPTVTKALEMLSAPFVGEWQAWELVVNQNIFIIVLITIFALTHRLDDHRLIKLATRRWRPEISWIVVLLFFTLGIAISQGNSGNFVYFDF